MNLLTALVQFDVAPSDPEINMERMETFIAEAARFGARLVARAKGNTEQMLTAKVTHIKAVPPVGSGSHAPPLQNG